MSTQYKLSELNLSKKEKNKIGHVLDLEKTYFGILWGIFSSKSFLSDLKRIENEIQNDYDRLSRVWQVKNKLKIAAERLVKQYTYSELHDMLTSIYPMPISSDIAIVTKDAVLNIDIKTLDLVGNRGDIINLQFENNQSSFENKNLDVDPRFPNSGVKVECLIPKTYKTEQGDEIPILSYFVTVIYSDTGTSFKLSRGDEKTIYLKCLPNGLISKLFKNDIVQNFKTYSYLSESNGVEFTPVFLCENKSEINNSIEQFIENNPNFIKINGRTKIGVYNPNQIHPIYNTLGVSWFPVKRKNKHNHNREQWFLEAAWKGNTNRLSNTTIEQRYDSRDLPWKGVKKKVIS